MKRHQTITLSVLFAIGTTQNFGRHNGSQRGFYQNLYKKKGKRGKGEGGKRNEIGITTLGSRGIDDERGNAPVTGARLPACGCAFDSLVPASWRASHASRPSRAYITLGLLRRRLLWVVVTEGVSGGREPLPQIDSV